MTLVLAALCALAVATPAWAATGELTPDTKMTVGGLDEGDQVSFYKLIKWVPGDGWAWADGVETAAATDPAITLPQLKTITGWTTPKPATAGVISAADGGALAQVAQRLSVAATKTVGTGATSVEYALANDATDAQKVDYLGLYVALVEPAKADVVYNPIFVAADYNPDSTNTNSITVEKGTLSYSPAALAKKEEVTLTKTSGTAASGSTPADVQYDVAVGDTIPFTIESVVPEYSTSYVDPIYEISDVMSTGLELLDDPAIVVQVKDTNASSWTTLTANTDYTVDGKTTAGFTVKLKSDYLKTNSAAKNIKVTYSAKVTSIDDTNVVKKDNTATVKFSNNPGNKDDYSLLEDKTYHYTFSLDANLLGNDEWENSELVKIGLNPDGTEITQYTLSNGHSAGVLEGATFGLYTDAACTQLYTNNNVTPAVTGQFTSDAHGKLNISGLDAGTYYLKEISAPAGYIKSTDTWQIVITPSYADVEAGTYTNAAGKTVKYDAYQYLTSYKVEITNKTTNTTVTNDFTITNTGTEKKTATASSTDTETKLNNTRGTELPSTGGMGTTILYTVGGILIAAGGIWLATKKRLSTME